MIVREVCRATRVRRFRTSMLDSTRGRIAVCGGSGKRAVSVGSSDELGDNYRSAWEQHRRAEEPSLGRFRRRETPVVRSQPAVGEHRAQACRILRLFYVSRLDMALSESSVVLFGRLSARERLVERV